MKSWLIGICLVALITIGVGIPIPLYYTLEPVSGRVIDAITKEPITGAAILVSWSAKGGFFIHEHSSGWLTWQYARTDKNGNFSVPGIPVFWREWYSSRAIDDLGPYIKIIKSGYVPELDLAAIYAGENVYYFKERDVGISWSGQGVVTGYKNVQIELVALPDDEDQRYKLFFDTVGFMRFSLNDCNNEELLNTGLFEEINNELTRIENTTGVVNNKKLHDICVDLIDGKLQKQF